jgi:Protein of unknown function (DUF1553)/Protein of unknown function (DUF1549)/Planctomycete cytochrome C
MRQKTVLCGLVLAGLAVTTAAEGAPKKLDFTRDIRPILSNNCFQCHGPDSNTRHAGLRLDERTAALAPLESGRHAIVSGDWQTSEIIERILTEDPAVHMPPPESGKAVTPEQLELLKRWISEGAEYKGHWAFEPIQDAIPPAVTRPDFVHNPIDQFILAKLEAAGLSPSKEADKRSLIRRVTLDLTGLPPSKEEIVAFERDQSANAYEKLVDRLLASPRYGEHMGRYWLDAARYGDTHGLHLDNERSMWPYREWVINALNSNMPFDRFTVEQLAGDLLPSATRSQRVATGFNRCNVSTSEGGAIDEEFRVRYAVDRVEVLGTVWMGMTLGCSVCHDHKFDPVTQKEFYQLFAYFNSMTENPMDGNALLPPPTLKLPSDDQTLQMATYERQLAEAQQQVGVKLSAIAYVDDFDADLPADALVAIGFDVPWVEDDTPAGAVKQADGHEWTFVGPNEGPVFSGKTSTRRTVAEQGQHFFTGATNPIVVGSSDRLYAYVYLDPQNPPKTIMLQWNDGSWEHRIRYGDNLIPYGEKGTPAHIHMGNLPPLGQWVRLEVPAATVGFAEGTKITGMAFTQYGGTVYWDQAGVRQSLANTEFRSLLAWEDFERSETKSTQLPHIQNLIKIPAKDRNAEQAKQLQDHFLRFVHADYQPQFAELNTRIDTLTKQKTELDGQIPATLVSEDASQPREAFVLVRGAYDKHGDKVERNVPSFLPPMQAGQPNNRLGLANWLIDPKHPLTSRVTVNRFWQQYFGTGIVKTSEDFGSQGQLPTHPELLDWLAKEFIRSGWDMKRMQKLIVMSGTYRQASAVSPELVQLDPANELLARGSRFRIDAEMLRDGALFVSGLLVERQGGKSVRTYQPDGIWEAVGFVGSNTRDFKRDQGESLFRRSLYTFWKRTAPPPSMQTFDAPSRETCTVRRARTNTPLQALVLMNDEQYVEAARNLAVRMLKTGGATLDEQLAFGFESCTARRPEPDELAVLNQAYAAQLAEFQQDISRAEQLLSIGTSPRGDGLSAPEHAAMTMVANLIMNLDETVTKE